MAESPRKSPKAEKAPWETADGIKEVADLLLGNNGLKIREGVELGKRVHYFKGIKDFGAAFVANVSDKMYAVLCVGAKLTEFLLTNDSKASARPDVSEKKDAHKVGKMLLKHQCVLSVEIFSWPLLTPISYRLIHKSDRNPENKKLLSPNGNQDWDDKAYYTWIYQGSQTFNHFMTGLLIISFLAVTCFPIWPKWMKVAIWYCSVTILIIFFIISVIRLIVAVRFHAMSRHDQS